MKKMTKKDHFFLVPQGGELVPNQKYAYQQVPKDPPHTLKFSVSQNSNYKYTF